MFVREKSARGHTYRYLVANEREGGRIRQRIIRALGRKDVLLAAILRTRPIYHSSDAAIRGHVFCSFLALMLRKELTDLCQRHGLTIEWADLLRDLDRLQEATIEKDGKRITTRTTVAGQIGSVFQAAGIALPPNLHERAA